MNPALLYLIVVNVYAFSIAVWDKNQARHGGRRISESNLMLSAVLGGGFGLMVAFFLVRHKTKKPKFMVGVPVIIALEAAAVVLILNYN